MPEPFPARSPFGKGRHCQRDSRPTFTFSLLVLDLAVLAVGLVDDVTAEAAGRAVAVGGLVVRLLLEVLGLGDPVQVTSEVLLDLLALAVFLKVAPRFGLFSLLGELSVCSKVKEWGKKENTQD